MATPSSQCSSSSSSRRTCSRMIRAGLLLLAITAVCDGILPEIVDSGLNHILQDHFSWTQPEPDSVLVEVEVEQLPQDPQQKSEDASHQTNNQTVSNPPLSRPNDTASEKVNDTEPVHSSADQETNNITTVIPPDDLGNHIDHGCNTHDDCGKEKYCLHETHNSKCLPCKATDVSCSKDEECCDDQLCIWGQCSQNATKGEAGSTCQIQTDCSPELCCAFHKALRFPVCSAKPIERERCFGASNHLTALLSWDTHDEGPKKNCPCAGDLHCQHLGRGSMCLKGEESSEEDLTDSLYSDIDYII